ncbi:MAG TPA: SAM-dependent methyltransferase [Cyanobacteria bacterium UBA8553]|nr:SAM-dependent methyltransferase [Cyanobacteria bacterium UBA8553]
MLAKTIQNIRVKISIYNRTRKYNTFKESVKPNSQTTILDVGYTDTEVAESYNFLEKNYPYPQNITALGLAEPQYFQKRYPQVKTVTYDGGKFPFEDKTFDVCWSNAVLEHVGNKEKQKLFLSEIKRVAKLAFITTPNKHFPIEIHTNVFLLHFLLSKEMFDKYLCLIGKEWGTGDWLNLLSLKDIKELLASVGVSNYKIIRNKLAGFTLDFVIIFGDVDLSLA